MQKSEIRDIFRDYITKKGLRHTRQREEILEAFFSAGKHITADDLYDALKKKNPGIGFATVHRNLKLMCESGLTEEIKVGNKRTRYEQRYGHGHHDHLICLKCGTFIEVKDEKIEKLQDKLAEANGFVPMRHKLEIYGLCRKCK
jgi:Fur family ferric uptake transcriptional regulator